MRYHATLPDWPKLDRQYQGLARLWGHWALSPTHGHYPGTAALPAVGII